MEVQTTRSLRRAYLDWIEEQVEEYKDTLSRSELLRLADEVVAELPIDRRGQYQLTELVLCDAVDRKIFRKLRLPGYRTWRGRLNGTNGSHAPEEPPAEPELGVFSTQPLPSE